MRTPPRRQWLWWFAIGGFVVNCAMVSVLLIRGPDSWLESGDKLASVLGLLVASAGLALTVASVRAALGRDDSAPAAVLLDRATDDLASQVARQWRDELDRRGLQAAQRMPVEWRWVDGGGTGARSAVFGSAGAPSPSVKILRVKVTGDVDSLPAALAGRKRRRVVVIGPPGAGKSVCSMVVTVDLATRRTSARDAVPVLLDVSEWHPDQERLEAWVIRRVEELYPGITDRHIYGANAARDLVTHGRVLPVLDGLDHLPSALRTAALFQLATAFRDPGWILLCRSGEFEHSARDLADSLDGVAVLELQPVSVHAAARYLASEDVDGHRRWAAVGARLTEEPDGALAHLLTNPLMLYLARVAFDGRAEQPDVLLTPKTLEELEDLLFERFLPAMYPAPGTDARQSGPAWPRPSRFSAAVASRAFPFLAAHLQDKGATDLSWWKLHHAAEGTAVLVTAPLIAATAWSLLDFFLESRPWPHLALLLSLLVLTALNLLASGATAGTPRLVRVEWHSFAGLFWFGFLGLLAVVSAVWFYGREAPTTRYDYALVGVAAFVPISLTAAASAVFWGGLVRPLRMGDPLTPDSTMRADRGASLLFPCATGAAGVAVGALAGPEAFGGVIVGGIIGCMLGLFGSVHLTSWPRFLAARWLLRRQGLIPRDLMGFLDDACRRGVLRRVGPHYQFNHVRLQEYLASRDL